VRIISDFKDYYDSALSFGADPNLLYVRKQEQFEYEKRDSPFEERKARLPRRLDEILRVPLELVAQLPHEIAQPANRYHYNWPDIPITVKLIGFCGFLFPAIEIDGKVFLSSEEVASGLPNAYLKQFNLDQEELERLLAMKHRRHRRWFGTPAALTHDEWATCAAGIAGKRFDDVFIQLGMPTFKVEYVAENKRLSVDRIRCTLNPYLKAEHFQRIKGPAETFQEISMYLGNQLARQPDPISTVSDEIMRDEKGFDEWSFRRHKEEDKKFRKRRQ
jgi:hypothetical protein